MGQYGVYLNGRKFTEVRVAVLMILYGMCECVK